MVAGLREPVDVKIRAGVAPDAGQPKVIGWDAAGVVRAVGQDVTRFKSGDKVWYAGSPGLSRKRAGPDPTFGSYQQRDRRPVLLAGRRHR